MDYPLPTAQAPEIARVQTLYREQYRVELSFGDAKELLERVMQFVYLTEMEDAIRPLMEDAKQTEEVTYEKDEIHFVRPQVQ